MSIKWNTNRTSWFFFSVFVNCFCDCLFVCLFWIDLCRNGSDSHAYFKCNSNNYRIFISSNTSRPKEYRSAKFIYRWFEYFGTARKKNKLKISGFKMKIFRLRLKSVYQIFFLGCFQNWINFQLINSTNLIVLLLFVFVIIIRIRWSW